MDANHKGTANAVPFLLWETQSIACNFFKFSLIIRSVTWSGVNMKQIGWVLLGGVLLGSLAQAQDRIYRCGNEYTNTVPSPQTKGCKLVEGGNVTVVQGIRPSKAATPNASPNAASAAGARVDASDQKSRDSDARLILQAELKKAEMRQEELLKEYNNGEPEKRGDESRNHQKYLDRVAELKANLARNESDMAGIKRELARQSGGTAAR
jgi:hypothetical protein